MGDSESPQGSGQNMSLNRKSGTQLALALTVLALILSANSIINQSWLHNSAELDTTGIGLGVDSVSMEMDSGLTGYNIETCLDDNCTSEYETYANLYTNCSKPLKDAEFNSTAIEEACGATKDMHNAGFVAKIMLGTSIVVLLYAVILQVKAMIGEESRKPNLVSGIGAILIGLSVLVWYLMLPESDTDPEIGQGVYMNFISIGTAFVASQSGVIQSWVDGPPRMRAHGIRASQDMDEFVLKESSCGDKTLSILVDDDLLRVVRVERVGSSPMVKDILATSRSSYTGFSHQRLDWLDDFRGVWWIVTGASMISIAMISSLFAIPLVIFGALAMAQLMDPERFVISTTSGDHSFIVNRWRSNRELTNLAMDIVDESMITVLRGEKLDSSMLESRANQIAERFSNSRESKRLSFEESNREKIAKQEEKAKLKAEKAAAKEKIKEAEAKAAAAEAKALAAEKEAQEKLAQMEKEMEEQKAKISENEIPISPPAVEQPAETSEPAPLEGPTATLPPPAAETQPLPLPPLPQADPAPVAMPPPPQPAAFIPPPPALPPLPMTGMPPPPQPAAFIPPPPQEAILPPPPVMVNPGPREENLSDDEKDNLLGELNS